MTTILNNRYQIINTLGSGGFGETFLAEDTYMPSRRRCVIKQLKPISNNPQMYQLIQERFAREAAILEELGRGNSQIPDLFAYFSEGGQFYLVQEYIAGETLTKLVQNQGNLSENVVKDILVKILPVLGYVHSKKIVHRDIKPENIIIRSSDSLPVLIDFGAVKEAMGTVVNSQGNSTASIVVGTPGFMPSEQAAGRPLYSSDLFSLGLTAIYLLTGKTPQQLTSDPHTGEVLWQQFAPQVSQILANILTKAVMSHPRDRYPSAQAMLQALQSPIPVTPIAPTIPLASPVPETEETLVVSPAGRQQQAQPVSPVQLPVSNNQNNSLLFGSLIAGGIIGASVVIGYALTRDPEPNTVISSTENSPAPTNSSHVTSSTNSDRDTLTTPPDNSSNVNTANPNNPLVNQPNNPNTGNPAKSLAKPSPKQALQDYYAIINQEDYQTSWSKFTTNFQNNSQVHPQGYQSYTGWWTTVDFVDIEDVRLVNEGVEVAEVDARLRYYLKSGRVSNPNLVRFRLVWDENTNQWLIDGAKSSQ
ncbi:protein kinase domain-containing protein [Oscillatoria salina]|uniref:protein kinase domain-containing protein n=1 Tax=Oscillatoria salina TaxID=331517 RepID=UPI001CC9E46E|nr:protein kinase [Oscillatoria salina]MBZ8178510.1 protein kinase [Oscillatoria salina IIICB1]